MRIIFHKMGGNTEIYTKNQLEVFNNVTRIKYIL